MLRLQVNWAQAKKMFLDGWGMYYEDKYNPSGIFERVIYCANAIGNIAYECNLKRGSSEYNEFDDIYLPLSNKPCSISDNKLNIHSSPRPFGTTTYFTGRCDDGANILDVGNGEKLYFSHNISDNTIQTHYGDFNVIENKTYIFDAHISWQTTDNDELVCEVVPRVTQTAAGANTQYNIYNGYLIVPAANNGTTTILSTDINLVEMLVNRFGQRSTAYWNATWNKVTKKFDNIEAAPLGDGIYNMFATEVILERFVNTFILDGSNSITFGSQDISQIMHGMRLKFTTTTAGVDHAWQSTIRLMMYREKTV